MWLQLSISSLDIRVSEIWEFTKSNLGRQREDDAEVDSDYFETALLSESRDHV